MKHKTTFSLIVLAILFINSESLLNLFMNHTPPQVAFQYKVKVAFPHLCFDHSVGIYNSGDETNRLFVVGQMGLIYVFENQRNVAETNIFLDIHNRARLGAFLGLAFDPNFTKNGHFYVNYLADNPLRTIIAQ
jgi:hypothetical protein